MTKTPPNRIGRRYKNIINTCQNCSKEFHPVMPRKDQKYCGHACYNAKRAADTVTKKCPQCLKDFTIKKIYDERYTVCSQECRLAARIYVNCKRCGRRFLSKKRDGVARSVHCSEECYRPPVMFQCKNCGNEFRDVPSSQGKKFFCSFSCYRRFEGETSIERNLRKALDELGIEYIQEAKVGRYSLDFAILRAKVDVEADGSYWHDPKRDARRDATLAGYGWTTIRFQEDDLRRPTAEITKLVEDRLRPLLVDAYVA